MRQCHSIVFQVLITPPYGKKSFVCWLQVKIRENYVITTNIKNCFDYATKLNLTEMQTFLHVAFSFVDCFLGIYSIFSLQILIKSEKDTDDSGWQVYVWAMMLRWSLRPVGLLFVLGYNTQWIKHFSHSPTLEV